MFHKFTLFLNKIANVVAVALLSAMTVVILLGVLFRYLLLKPLPWSEDLGRYLMIWLALLAVGVVMQNRRHVAVTLAIEWLQPGVRLVVMLLADALVVGFGSIMGVLSIQYLTEAMPQISPSLHIDLWWVYLAFPFYAFLLVISTIDQMIEHTRYYLTHQKPERKAEGWR